MWVNSPEYREYRKYKIDYTRMTIERRDGKQSNMDLKTAVSNIYTGLSNLTGENDKPARFETMIQTWSESTNLKEAIKEWKEIARQLGPSEKCICSHHITRNCFIINTLNGNILGLGIDCIKKIGFSESKIKSLKKFFRNKDKQEGRKYKECLSCKNYEVFYESTENICDSCKEKVRQEEERQQQIKQEEEIKRLQIKRDEEIKVQSMQLRLQIQQEAQTRTLPIQQQNNKQEGRTRTLPIQQENNKQEARTRTLPIQQQGETEEAKEIITNVIKTISRVFKHCDQCGVCIADEWTRCNDCFLYNLSSFDSITKLDSKRDKLVAIWLLNVIKKVLQTPIE